MMVTAKYTGSITAAHGLVTVVGPCPIVPGRFELETAVGTLYQVRPESFEVRILAVGSYAVVI